VSVGIHTFASGSGDCWHFPCDEFEDVLLPQYYSVSVITGECKPSGRWLSHHGFGHGGLLTNTVGCRGLSEEVCPSNGRVPSGQWNEHRRAVLSLSLCVDLRPITTGDLHLGVVFTVSDAASTQDESLQKDDSSGPKVERSSVASSKQQFAFAENWVW